MEVHKMYDASIHHRRSIRLADFDYTTAGVYFVTVCVQDRVPLLGNLSGGKMQENEAGLMVRAAWEGLPEHYPGVSVDAFVSMPDHVHGILVLNDHDPNDAALSLPDIMQRWKSWTTTLYRRGVNEQNWQPFPSRLWQRNYYERIVRDEKEWQRYKDYIGHNPLKWADDTEFIP